jgi:methyl-accepting chemotaxis protein
VAVLASGFVGLQSSQAVSQTALFQEQVGVASAQLTTALLLLQADNAQAHVAVEDAAESQPHQTLLSDQEAVKSLSRQYEAEIAAFVRENLLAQHPAQAEWLNQLGQGAAIEQQHGLVISLISTWQRYAAAQTEVLQDILAGKVIAAETLARVQADPMATDVLSAISSLIQFERGLGLSVQSAARLQEGHDQRVRTLLAASAALAAILIAGLLVTISLLGPLQRLRQVTQAGLADEREARLEVIGHDEIAAISSDVNDMLAAIDSLMAEVSRQHQGIVSCAERLFSEVSGGDTSDVRAQLAEVGDPLKVLDTICNAAIAHFHHQQETLYH